MLQKVGVLLLTIALLSSCMTEQIETPVEVPEVTNQVEKLIEKTPNLENSEAIEDEELEEFENTLIELLESEE